MTPRSSFQLAIGFVLRTLGLRSARPERWRDNLLVAFAFVGVLQAQIPVAYFIDSGIYSPTGLAKAAAIVAGAVLLSLLSPHWHAILAIPLGVFGIRWLVAALLDRNALCGVVGTFELSLAVLLARRGPWPGDWENRENTFTPGRRTRLAHAASIVTIFAVACLVVFIAEVALIKLRVFRGLGFTLPVTALIMIGVALALSWVSDSRASLRTSLAALAAWFVLMLAMARMT